MHRFAFAALVAGALVLSACTAQQLSGAAQEVQQICRAAAPTVNSLTGAGLGGPNTTAGNLLGWAQTACNADGTIAAGLQPNIDASTPAWLADIITGLTAAAKVAPVVLPARATS